LPQPEVGGEAERNENLQPAPHEERHHHAERSEHEMPELVDREVEHAEQRDPTVEHKGEPEQCDAGKGRARRFQVRTPCHTKRVDTGVRQPEPARPPAGQRPTNSRVPVTAPFPSPTETRIPAPYPLAGTTG